jgi:hypothetical protein
MVPMKGRVRLCPYYFVSGEGDAARPRWAALLATIVPADKKIVHGMSDAGLDAEGVRGPAAQKSCRRRAGRCGAFVNGA